MAYQVIGTRGKIHTSGYGLANTGPNQNKRTYIQNFVICCDVDSISLTYPGHHIDQGAGFVEVENEYDLLIRTSIQIGDVITPLLYSGSRDGSLVKGAILNTDSLSINISAGTPVKILTYIEAPVGGNWSGGIYLESGNGEGCAPYGTDYTLTGATGLQSGVCFNPLAISGNVVGNAKPAVSLFGDSILDLGNAVDARSYMAIILDALQIPYVNFAVRGYSANGFKTASNHIGINQAVEHLNFSKALLDIGGANDFQGSGTAEVVYSDTLLVHDLIRNTYGIPSLANLTIMPMAVSSSDVFTTFSGQTMRGHNAYRAAYHALLRSTAGLTIIEVAKHLAINGNGSSDDDAERWINGMTTDGVHPTTATHIQLSQITDLIDQVTAFIITPPEPIQILVKHGKFVI